MSYKTPTNPTLAALKGVDKVIQDIAGEMDMSWLSYSFGLADRLVKVDNETEMVFPACFESNRIDPISMMPSDLYTAYSFWIKQPGNDFEGLEYPRSPIQVYDVSCIFYMDLRRIDNTLTYKETKSKVREDIFNFFNYVNVNGMLTYVNAVEDDITQIYNGFSIEQVDNIYKMYPKWAIRLNFELRLRDGCYSTNTYTIT